MRWAIPTSSMMTTTKLTNYPAHTMQKYNDYWFQSDDGLTLYARDYQHHSPQATILCIPGLTRNSADFSHLCEHLADQFRVVAVELRGRGRSEYDPNPRNYHPGVYVQDMVALLDSLQLESVVLIGTSLGGLISMFLTAMQSNRITAVVINDIGPEVNQDGLDRIKSYVCNPSPVSNWEEAISKTREVHGREFPNFSDADWALFTNNLFRENSEGQPELNYDPAISVLLEQNQDDVVPPDLWPAFNAMGPVPLLLLRGELSDILARECVAKMQRIKPDMQFTEVANCGHAPLLTESESLQSINTFLYSLSLGTK